MNSFVYSLGVVHQKPSSCRRRYSFGIYFCRCILVDSFLVSFHELSPYTYIFTKSRFFFPQVPIHEKLQSNTKNYTFFGPFLSPLFPLTMFSLASQLYESPTKHYEPFLPNSISQVDWPAESQFNHDQETPCQNWLE